MWAHASNRVKPNPAAEKKSVMASARQIETDLRGGNPGIGRLVDESLAIPRDLPYKRFVFKSKKPWTLSLFYPLWFF